MIAQVNVCQRRMYLTKHKKESHEIIDSAIF